MGGNSKKKRKGSKSHGDNKFKQPASMEQKAQGQRLIYLTMVIIVGGLAGVIYLVSVK